VVVVAELFVAEAGGAATAAVGEDVAAEETGFFFVVGHVVPLIPVNCVKIRKQCG
jgi:hypothetical protein